MRWTRLTLVLLAAAAAGCASNGPSSVLAEGPRMIDLYRGTPGFGTETGADEPRDESPPRRCRWWLFARKCEAPEAGTEEPDRSAGPEAATYTRTAANELELLFPRLPNPDIYIYVTPHLATDERVPVPGYTTAVPLYERVEYALPGEREQAARRLQPGRDEATGEAAGSPMAGAPGDVTPAPRRGESK
ncbi:MAG: TIGR03751 family conjugal transfer lipoprotein [Defluviicoccus sp.]|nr:TIGR03751 family conjugal transfer lipoprotein [Defluviicoccus sp.]